MASFAPQPTRKPHTSLYVAVAIVLVIVAALAALAAAGVFTPKSAPATTPTVVQITPAGTVWNIGVYGNVTVGPVNLTSHSSWTLSGNFTTSFSIDVFVMTAFQYLTWHNGTPSPQSFWTSGDVISGSVNANLDSGTYYVCWLNGNPNISVKVNITSDIVATSS